jgi:hypothetical protein
LQFPLDPNGLELPSEATLDFDTRDATRTALPYLHALCRCSLDSPVRHGRAILTRVKLLSAVGGNYGWLNTSFIVGEGEIDEETDEWWIQAYVCIMRWSPILPRSATCPQSGFAKRARSEEA